VADYDVDIRTLAAESAWNPESLFDTFLHGLSEVIKDELAAQELPVDLDSLTIRIDGHLRECRSERRSIRYGSLTSEGIQKSPKAVFPRGSEATRPPSRITDDG
jgi:hypothetical protein